MPESRGTYRVYRVITALHYHDGSTYAGVRVEVTAKQSFYYIFQWLFICFINNYFRYCWILDDNNKL